MMDPRPSKAKLGRKVPKKTATAVTKSKTGRTVFRKKHYARRKKQRQAVMREISKGLAEEDPSILQELGSSFQLQQVISMAGLSRDEGRLVPGESEQQLPKKRSCVKRVLSGYNLFCQEKSSQPAFKALTTAERFRRLSREWNALSQGEKDDIKARAKEAQGKVVNVKKETKKSIDKMMSIIDHLQTIDSYDVLFVCVGGEGQETYGGSDKGRQFVEENIHILDDFGTFVDASNRSRMRSERPNGTVKDIRKLNGTVKDIRKLFNAKYAAAVGKPSAKMPYAAIEKKGVTMDGMPGGLPIRRPGQYGSAQLRKIWDARNTLQCVIRQNQQKDYRTPHLPDFVNIPTQTGAVRECATVLDLGCEKHVAVCDSSK